MTCVRDIIGSRKAQYRIMSEKSTLLLLLLLGTCSITFWLHFTHRKAHPLKAHPLRAIEAHPLTAIPHFTLEKHLYNVSESVPPIKESTAMSLASCPVASPHLVGPLRVQIDWNMTLETVRNKLSPGLQVGGRYTPPDCNSLHKVRYCR